MTVTLGEFPEKEAASEMSSASGIFDGLHVVDLTKAVRSRYHIPPDITGVAVDEVEQQSEAYGVLRPGDVIRQINRQDIASVREFSEVTGNIAKDAGLLLLIYRNGVHLYITIGG